MLQESETKVLRKLPRRTTMKAKLEIAFRKSQQPTEIAV